MHQKILFFSTFSFEKKKTHKPSREKLSKPYRTKGHFKNPRHEKLKTPKNSLKP
jgi:hypothetical protein